MTTTVQQEQQAPPPLERHVLVVAAIVVLGAITTVLDATIVSVAIDTLARHFNAPLPTIQWVMTGYIVALAAVIPLTGWAADRFGGKQLWMFSLALFVGSSVLCGLAWSAESLVIFRVLQGLGGGMVAPAGMSLVAQAAGPQRMGRAMGIVGTPMMLGPVVGPVLGGVLISSVSWQWIFFINAPIGIAALIWSWRSLAPGTPRRSERLDVKGMLILSPGLAALVYGVSALSSGDSLSPRVLIGVLGGVAMFALFTWHALHAERPLLDLRHFANRTFTSAASIQALIGVSLHGAMLLLPLYYQLVHGVSPAIAGIVLIPQGAGAALAISLTSKLVDRGYGKRLVLSGLSMMVAGFVAYTQSTADTSLVLMSASLLVLGFGTGCLMSPVTSAAYSAMDRAAIPRATSTLNILQRVGGAIGTAVYAVVLQHQLAGSPTVAEAFNTTFWWPLAAIALGLIPALLLPSTKRN